MDFNTKKQYIVNYKIQKMERLDYMALINCDFFSEVLGFSTGMTVILPQSSRGQIGVSTGKSDGKPPLLYLLHGYSDNHTAWLRYSSIERYATNIGIAVVMPNVNLSYYTDMKNGGKYWTFISEELPSVVKSFFNVSAKSTRTFVAGLSMGGYGAFKLALAFPNRFAGAASFSGGLDVFSIYQKAPKLKKKLLKRTFGSIENLPGSYNDLYSMAHKLYEKGIKPPMLYQSCGTEDFLYEDNLRFRDFLRQLDFDLLYEEAPGAHEWDFWDMAIQRYLLLISDNL